jgi:branched-chain amino acid transport system ATP-binding protein
VTAVDGTPVDVAASTTPTSTRSLKLAGALAGASATPLLVLFGMNFLDEFDRIAFAALTPEIRDAFNLTDGAIVAIGAVSALFMLVGALPLGYLGDRFPRTRVVTVCAVVWSLMCVVVGLAWIVPVLFMARLFGGVARTSNEVLHPSLLVDYYEPSTHPRVFQIHRIAHPLSAVFGLAAGGLGALLGWRPTFIISAVPMTLLIVALARLPEPRRGGARPPLGPEEIEIIDDEVPLSFREARRQVFQIRTLKRTWFGGFLLGAAFIAAAQLLSLYFEHVYDYGPLGRGVVQFVFGAGIVAGIMIGAGASARAAASGNFARLPLVIAASFLTCSAALVGMAAMPWVGTSIAFALVLGIGLGIYQPAYYPLVGRIVPPRVRTQGFAYTLVFAGLGALLAVPLAKYGENSSYRGAFAILAVLVTVGAAIVATATRYVDEDIARIDAASA